MYDVWLDGRMFGCLFCLLVLQTNLTNSRTSWRLNADKVVQTTDFVSNNEDDPIFYILASSVSISNGQGWSKTAASEKLDKVQVYFHECKGFGSDSQDR